MNGVHISGFVSIDLEKSVYPASLIPELNKLDYRLDVNSELAHQSLDLFVEDLEKTLAARIKAYRYLWNYLAWQTFMLVFSGTDRLMHFLWQAYEDKNHKYHRMFLGYFQKIDTIIAEIQRHIEEQDLLIILSDHGFERLNKDIYINYFLKESGFLKFRANAQEDLQNIDILTKAFALDPARIYINLKGKYPQGKVETADKDKVMNDLEGIFASWEIEGKRVVKKTYRKEEIYHGPFLEQAPDLILLAEENFNFRASLPAPCLAKHSLFTGKHSYHNAFLLLNQKNAALALAENPGLSCLEDLL